MFLSQLNISPWNQETWPLQVYPRTLSVLAQILMLRQQREKDDLRSESEQTCVLIWQKLLYTIKKAILSTSQFTEEGEDINVEHAQLMLFLFHNIQLMQKKHILLLTAQTIIDVAVVVQSCMKDFQILYLARLLLLFEYMMKNLYDAPPSLIEQIQKNLFTIQNLSISSEKDNTKRMCKTYFSCKDVEDNYVKNLSSDELQSKF
ncbi:protein purity of essence-like [Centruroides sculpturatus]|uniref:protein purity of essence-like n=1 Tax=Centruroides sculpturatus TaxID=218467 RepID=UPI000C6DEB6B|nr:protein purity of essence-like [Centruroides sculpturatus]